MGVSVLETLLITSQDVAHLVELESLDGLMDRMIARLTQVFKETAKNEVELRPRNGFTYDKPHPGVLEWMPHMHAGRSATIKVVSYNPTNPEFVGIPTIISIINVFDINTGHLTAVMDGTFLTALRTGAASAVASRLLARPDSCVIGLVGCGAQAVTQLHALSRIFKLHEVVIYDTDPEQAASFPQRISFIDIPVRVVTLGELETVADIICTATSVAIGDGPVILGEALQEHVHINAVGSDLPGKIELPLELLKNCLLCPDYRVQAMVEGECQQVQPENIGPDLLTLVAHPEQYEAWQSKRTVFDATGFALEDSAAADLLLFLARQYEIGTRIKLEHCPIDAYNPYDFSYVMKH